MTEPRAVLARGWFEPVDCRPLGDGHINDTYLITDAAGCRCVLQRINEAVFPEPLSVQANVDRVLAHVSVRSPDLLPRLRLAKSGRTSFQDVSGGVWRLWEYVEDSRPAQRILSSAMASAAGQAFGDFQRVMRDLPEPRLVPVIHEFLELGHYLEELEAVGGYAPILRDTGHEPDFIARRASLAAMFPKGEDYIHGDCKIDNLLFAQESDEVRCIVDLDTVMTGHWAWDFGDLVRSAVGASDLGLTGTFAALADGFVSACPAEVEARHLVFAPQYVAFMLGVRFLTDHQQGDVYFKVSSHGENLSRAARQFELLIEFEGLKEPLTSVAERALEQRARD